MFTRETRSVSRHYDSLKLYRVTLLQVKSNIIERWIWEITRDSFVTDHEFSFARDCRIRAVIICLKPRRTESLRKWQTSKVMLSRALERDSLVPTDTRSFDRVQNETIDASLEAGKSR